MRAFLVLFLLGHQLFSAQTWTKTKCPSLLAEIPEKGVELDETQTGLIILVTSDSAVGIMRWISSTDFAVLAKETRPNPNKKVIMEITYSDGTVLEVTVLNCNGTLYHRALWVTSYSVPVVACMARRRKS